MSKILDLPKFKTQRLLLRQVYESDFPSYTKNFVDYEVIRYLSSAVPWPYPENGVESFYKEMIWPQQGKERWTWGIFLKENPDEVIGVVDLWRKGCPEHRGFWLAKKHWGQGIMTEAVTPIMDYAFNELGFEKLVFANAVGNTRSRRIKEKTGAKLIDVVPASFVDPQFTEHEVWELKKEDWFLFKIAKPYKVIANYNECYPDYLNLKTGDKIQLFIKEVPDKWKGWNWCKDSKGLEGWISESYFKKNDEGAEIIKDYTAKELSVKKNDEVILLYEDFGWAWCQTSTREEGWLPLEILNELF